MEIRGFYEAYFQAPRVSKSEKGNLALFDVQYTLYSIQLSDPA